MRDVAPSGRTGRASWHRRANAVVLGWLLASAVLAALPDGWLPAPRWLALHTLFVGAATTAIIVWSAHFAAALTRAAAASRLGLIARLGMIQVGAVLVLLGTPQSWTGVLDVGAALIAGAVVWHLIALTGMLRRAVAPRLGVVVRWYIAAALLLLAGGFAGVLIAAGAPGPVPLPRLVAAHVVLMLFGWLGMTVIGTLITLWPTVLRTRMDARSDTAARRALVLCASGVVIAAAGFVLPAWPLTVAGLLGYAGGVLVALQPLVAAARQRPPSTGAAWSLAAALAWFVAVLARTLLACASAGADTVVSVVDRLVPAVAVGFLGQVVLGALTGLLPTVLGGGPHAVRAAIARLEIAWRLRLVALNAGLAAAVLPLPAPVRTAGWLLVLFGAATPFLVLAFSLIARRPAVPTAPPLARRDAGDLPSPRPPAEPATERRAVSLGAAFGAVLLLAAVLFAVSGRGGHATSSPVVSSASGSTRTVAVTLDMMRIQPRSVSVPAGTHLVLQVTNRDGMRHDLALPSGKRTPLLSKGQSARLDAGVVTRAMTLKCTVPGHAAAGMTMTVTLASAAAAPSARPAGRSAATAFDPTAKPAASDSYRDPRLAAVPAGTVHRITIHARDRVLTVAPGVRQLMWTFNGTVPGPTLHGTVGDTFYVTLVNDTTMGHSIDFHAGEVSPDEVMRTIEPGASLHYRFRADHSGIWMYHCSTTPMTMHIGNGMYGAVVVDPPDLAPVDHEYVLVQSELYLGAQDGVGNAAGMAAGTPDAVVFNGQSNQYDTHPLTARPGQRIRIWVLDAGLALPSSFHVVGTQFDTVFSEGAYLLRRGNPEQGAAQVLALQPAQGGFVEFTVPAAGHYAIVSHRMVDASRGAHGVLVAR